MTKEEQQQLTPEGVLESLKAGNLRYMAGVHTPRDFRSQMRESLEEQYPEAIILSCIDSRVPVEYIFDRGVGDLFVSRIAGNVVYKHMLGSIEFACKVAGAKLVVVMGHEDCGAVKAAIKGVELGHITHIMDKLRPVIEHTEYMGPRVHRNKAFADAVALQNVRMTIEEIRHESQILTQMEQEGAIRIYGAIYSLSTGEVHFLDYH
ncbi:carbonic anhydrase family protein [Porphyromonas sp. COT-290 OH3588]|uniref:carbonic anhydrase family protein n=1 Tax=Porphyromonas sp. COT-290 OH3588 TaxID=1515617 RepID=UPI00052BB9D9|nr:carbonic anhydrase family protein [Porphyromonas sp. COT-290 OH3588]KGN97861.1 carbonic anhydrase [Porphyromonas sp. COT-290 OH3588]